MRIRFVAVVLAVLSLMCGSNATSFAETPVAAQQKKPATSAASFAQTPETAKHKKVRCVIFTNVIPQGLPYFIREITQTHDTDIAVRMDHHGPTWLSTPIDYYTFFFGKLCYTSSTHKWIDPIALYANWHPSSGGSLSCYYFRGAKFTYTMPHHHADFETVTLRPKCEGNGDDKGVAHRLFPGKERIYVKGQNWPTWSQKVTIRQHNGHDNVHLTRTWGDLDPNP